MWLIQEQYEMVIDKNERPNLSPGFIEILTNFSR